MEWSTTGNTYAVSQRHARKELAAQPYRLARIKRGPYLDGGQRSLPERRAYALTKSFSKVSGIGKRDDRFLRTHRDRISPEAERGYEYLRSGRNSAAAEAGVGTAATGLSGFIAARSARHGGKVGYSLAGLAGAAAVGNGVQAVQQGRKAHRWNSKMGRIRAKAKERATAGEYGRGRVVEERSSQKVEGAAQVAAGGAALGLGLSANRVVTAAELAGNARVERLRGAKISALGNPVVRTVVGAERAAKERAKARTKANQGVIDNVNRRANKTRRVLRSATGGKTRSALVAAGYATAIPTVWLGSHKIVEKAVDTRDVDSFMVGALATGGAYHGGLYATKRVDRRIDLNIANSPHLKETLAQHKRNVGLPKHTPAGDPRWLKYNREYPKSIPGWKWKRTLSRLHGGKSQIAISGTAAAIGGLGVTELNRKINPVSERLKKDFFSKGLFPVPRPKLSMMPRRNSVRSSYTGTSRLGRKFTVSGSVR